MGGQTIGPHSGTVPSLDGHALHGIVSTGANAAASAVASAPEVQMTAQSSLPDPLADDSDEVILFQGHR